MKWIFLLLPFSAFAQTTYPVQIRVGNDTTKTIHRGGDYNSPTRAIITSDDYRMVDVKYVRENQSPQVQKYFSYSAVTDGDSTFQSDSLKNAGVRVVREGDEQSDSTQVGFDPVAGLITFRPSLLRGEKIRVYFGLFQAFAGAATADPNLIFHDDFNTNKTELNGTNASPKFLTAWTKIYDPGLTASGGNLVNTASSGTTYYLTQGTSDNYIMEFSVSSYASGAGAARIVFQNTTGNYFGYVTVNSSSYMGYHDETDHDIVSNGLSTVTAGDVFKIDVNRTTNHVKFYQNNTLRAEMDLPGTINGTQIGVYNYLRINVLYDYLKQTKY